VRRLLLLAGLFASAALAHANTPLAAAQTFTGRLNVTGTQASMRTHNDNSNKPCQVESEDTVLTGKITDIPNGAVIVSAKLYWAGSGDNKDYVIKFNGNDVTATGTYETSDHLGQKFFSGALDVTTEVAALRNYTYTFSGLKINSGSTYCTNKTVVGGFQLVVVYSRTSERPRRLTVYEGFQYLYKGGQNLTMGAITLPAGSATAIVGQISWGGSSLVEGSENLRLNNAILNTSGKNKTGELFSSKSSLGGNAYGMDYDFFTSTSYVAGDTSATARIETGDDGVFVSAVVLAMPIVSADLSITKTLSGSLAVGQPATYLLTVTNAGPDPEPGPITVVDTLPDGLSYVSGTGTGWSCEVNGQTVTCTRAGALAVGATASTLTIVANVTSGGTKTNTASATGTAYDPTPATATHSGLVGTPAASGYVFTDKACTSGLAFGSPGQPCTEHVWTSTVAGVDIPLYITSVANNVPTAGSTSDRSVAFQFALTCHNPQTPSSVNAVLGTTNLGACAGPAGPIAWTAANVAFVANAASSALHTFNYDDVGRIELHMRTGGVQTNGGAFMSQPAVVRLGEVKSGAISNPATDAVDGLKFIVAGAKFSMSVGVYTDKGGGARNFGNEDAPESFTLAKEAGTTSPGFEMNVPDYGGAFGPIVNGVASGAAFTWNEVGSFKLTPSINHEASGLSIYSPASLVPATIGRFIPDHFETVVTGPMACATAMGCAAPMTAAYSGQPFGVEVIARSATGDVTTNYQHALARTVVLTAWDAAGGAGQNPSWPAVDASTFTLTTVAQASFNEGRSTDVPAPAPVYRLRNVYATAMPGPWTAPTTIFIRASEDATGDGVGSKDALPGTSLEGAVRILAGRLQVSNTHGSERLKLSVPLTAQYWTGTAWVNSTTDTGTVSQIVKTDAMSFSNCKGKLLLVDGNCAAALSGIDQNPAYLATGKTKLILNAPNLTGWADAKMDNPAWLPSTVGRIHFGTYRSPLIYVREVF
jgi:MSHA biogenesis protein MshQ